MSATPICDAYFGGVKRVTCEFAIFLKNVRVLKNWSHEQLDSAACLGRFARAWPNCSHLYTSSEEYEKDPSKLTGSTMLSVAVPLRFGADDGFAPVLTRLLTKRGKQELQADSDSGWPMLIGLMRELDEVALTRQEVSR